MNQYDALDWKTMLASYPAETDFKIEKYYKILSPSWPDFLNKYINVPSMQRLKGIGLLCGTDWTNLYKNRFFYSRLDHSIGVALIVWNFTKDKKQTLAGLFHDISTPIFSHVSEFRKGDALTQTESENETENVILQDKELCGLLKQDNIKIEEISDYHIYPVADNERPQLSADRLEYMFPSGASLQGSWNLKEIQKVYQDIKILKNEKNIDELGFSSLDLALLYCKKFCETGHILQLNENKLTLQLLAKVTEKAISLNLITEEDCLKITEKEAMERFENAENEDFQKLYKTFRNMNEILHTEEPVSDSFCVNLKVKQRYINPLVQIGNKTLRLTEASEEARRLIQDFLEFHDTAYGCVKYL